jgi:hypothetical protein
MGTWLVSTGIGYESPTTVAPSIDIVAESSCRTRYGSGARIAVSRAGIVRSDPDGSSETLVVGRGIGFACLAPDDSANQPDRT